MNNDTPSPGNRFSRREMLKLGGLGLFAAGMTSPANAQPAPPDASPISSPPSSPPRPGGNSGMTHVVIKPDNLALVRDRTKCIACGDCLTYCYRTGTVHGYRSSEDRSSCINCGQCSIRCRPGSITEKSHLGEFQAALNDPETIVIATTSPAVRVALGEYFQMPVGSYVEGKMVAGLKTLGCRYVLDTTFGADLTVMEEASELLRRLEKDESSKYPMFTSCCPAWIRFAELFFPQLLPHLSTTKSPILMQGATIKTWFAEKNKLDPKKIVNVAVTPCTAKKAEIRRPGSLTLGFQPGFEGIHEIDLVLTARELGSVLRSKDIDFAALEDKPFDSFMGRGSGSGIAFGRSGGVMASALRTGYHLAFQEEAPLQKTVNRRGQDQVVSWTEMFAFGRLPGVRVGKVDFKGREIRIATVETMSALRGLIDVIENDDERFDFVEVMACQGGCLGGGGQPYPDTPGEIDRLISMRKEAIQEGIKQSRVRLSHENREIVLAYREFFGEPLGEKAKALLHCRPENG